MKSEASVMKACLAKYSEFWSIDIFWIFVFFLPADSKHRQEIEQWCNYHQNWTVTSDNYPYHNFSWFLGEETHCWQLEESQPGVSWGEWGRGAVIYTISGRDVYSHEFISSKWCRNLSSKCYNSIVMLSTGSWFWVLNNDNNSDVKFLVVSLCTILWKK